MVVAFDLDDTLYKEADYALSAYREIAIWLDGEFGIPADEAFGAMSRALRDGGNPFDAAQALAGRSLPVVEMVAAYRRHKPSISLDGVTENALSGLREAGHALCLITDGRSLTQRNKMDALGLWRWFASGDVLISEETGSDKTVPDNFRRVERLHPGGRYAYVGDNPAKDFLHPNAMGWTTICLKDDGRNIHPQRVPQGGGFGAKYEIDSLAELPDIIDMEK